MSEDVCIDGLAWDNVTVVSKALREQIQQHGTRKTIMSLFLAMIVGS